MDELGQTARTKTSSGLEIGIRPIMKGLDDPIIYAPWCNHIRRTAPFSDMTAEEFREHKKGLLERLVARHGVTVACHRAMPEVVHGWICGDPFERVCHFLYVKDEFRGRGIARSLIEHEFPSGNLRRYYTHKSRQAPALAKKFGFTYNPYLIEKNKADLLG